MKNKNMIMAALLVIAMMVSMIPVIDAGVPAIGTDATVANVSPGNANYTTVPAYINFTADVSGIGANDTVWLVAVYNNGSSALGEQMTNNSGTYYYNWTSPSESVFTYHIEIRNATANVTNQSESYKIIIDATGPVIEAAAGVIEGNPMTIDVTDAGAGVKFVNITVNATVNGTMQYFNLTATDGAVHFSEDFAIGTYNYTVYAEDVFGHNATKEGNFTVTEDTTAPVISDIPTGVSVKQNMPVNITATITDDGLGVQAVVINITHPDGTYTAGNMTLYNGTYYFEFTETAAMGQYNFTINATDGKQSSEASGTFNVIDGIAPVINSVTPIYISNNVILVANITDNVVVASAKITITKNISGNVTIIVDNEDMTVGNYTDSENNTYTGYVYMASNLALGEYNYTITAEDAKGNVGTYSNKFTVSDNTPPSITDIVVPENVVEGNSATISCQVTDDFGVASVTVSVTHDGQTETYNMTLTDGHYTYTIEDTTYGEYVFTITATDVNGNSVSSDQQRFNVADADKPTASPSPDNPTEAELGSTITISYTVSDPDGIQSVVLHYYVDNASEEQQITMTATGNGTYSAEIELPTTGSTLTYWVVATDNDGSETATQPVSISLSQPETGFEMSTAMLAGIGIILVIIIIAVVMMMKKKPASEEATEEESSEEQEEDEESEEDVDEESAEESEEEDELGEDL